MLTDGTPVVSVGADHPCWDAGRPKTVDTPSTARQWERRELSRTLTVRTALADGLGNRQVLTLSEVEELLRSDFHVDEL